jgi:hypothetical protein
MATLARGWTPDERSCEINSAASPRKSGGVINGLKNTLGLKSGIDVAHIQTGRNVDDTPASSSY